MIKQYSNGTGTSTKKFACLSTDTKPTTLTAEDTGSICKVYDADTKKLLKVYMWFLNDWFEE